MPPAISVSIVAAGCRTRVVQALCCSVRRSAAWACATAKAVQPLSLSSAACCSFSSVSCPPSRSAAVVLSGYSSSPSSLSSVLVSAVPTPSVSLLPRAMLLRVLAVSVNPLDVMTACGYGRSALSLARPSAVSSYPESSYPALGRDAVGVVERVGSAVWRYSRGDTLWVSRDPLAGGTFAQYIAVDGNSTRPLHSPVVHTPHPAKRAALTRCPGRVWCAVWCCCTVRVHEQCASAVLLLVRCLLRALPAIPSSLPLRGPLWCE